jgi:outer membrane autotransporter protein
MQAGAAMLALMAMFLALTLVATQTARAQETTLVAVYQPNFDVGVSLSLVVFGEAGTTGTITNNDGLEIGFTIGDDGLFQTELDLGDVLVPTDGDISQTALFITAENPISGLAVNRRTASTDMTSLLVTEGLGNEYYVLGYQELNSSNPSQMSITALHDGTEITLTPSNDLSGGFTAGEAHVIVLDAGESIGLSGFDVSGTHVIANHDIAVFAGVQCTNIPPDVFACDHIISQNFSVDNFSTDFRMVQTPLAGADADLVRVIAATDATEVFINGVSQGTIDAGEFLEIDNVGNSHITATAPVQVGQYMRGQGGSRELGDPAFAVLPGTNQWLDSYVYATPADDLAMAENFMMVVISEEAVSSLVLNGDPVTNADFAEVEILDGFVYGIIAIEPGAGDISASEPFLAMISGFDSFDSFLTTIGTTFSAGASPGVPGIVTTIGMYDALPRVLSQMAAPGSLRERVGSRLFGQFVQGPNGEITVSSSNLPEEQAAAGQHGIAWLSVTAESLRPRAADFAVADQVRQTTSNIKLGYDLPSIVTETGSLVPGAFVTYQRGSATIDSIFGTDKIKTTGLGAGASLTWYALGGTYVDVVASHTRLRNTLDNVDEKHKGSATTLSAEVGHAIAMPDAWTITPQAQLSFTKLDLNDITGPFGEVVEFRDTDTVRGRIGATFDRSWEAENGGMNTVYLSANLIGELSYSAEVEVTAGNSVTTITGAKSRALVEVGVGGQVSLNENSYISGALHAARHMSSGGGTNLRGQFGVNFRW